MTPCTESLNARVSLQWTTYPYSQASSQLSFTDWEQHSSCRASLDSDHILYSLLSGSSDAHQVRLRSKCQFVSAAWNLLDNLARLGICASEWTNHKWNAEYCKNTSRLCVFIPRIGARSVGMSLPQAAWVKLNDLWTGVGQFDLFMHKWGLTPLSNCKCGAAEQTADHILIACPIHQAAHKAKGLIVLDDKT